ncbi:uncharacterized protein METZ01_LOCUS242571 [marine metagenome]|uniref:Uncharacterized protein n=1 Tax=marine metagenome TaxID=408172 RepID=A0A382HS10_9ZZZZ
MRQFLIEAPEGVSSAKMVITFTGPVCKRIR